MSAATDNKQALLSALSRHTAPNTNLTQQHSIAHPPPITAEPPALRMKAATHKLLAQVKQKQSTYKAINIEQFELDSNAQHAALTGALEN